MKIKRHKSSIYSECAIRPSRSKTLSTTTEQKSSYDREDLLACAHGELFGPGNARLPLPNMLMMDRITHISDQGGKYGKGEIFMTFYLHRYDTVS